jgi:hypothetical protein
MRWLLALAVVVTVPACASDSMYLPALRADPIAHYSHPELDVTLRAETPEAVNLLGQPTSARITTVFAVDDTSDVDVVERDLQAQAEQAGWTFEAAKPAESPEEARRLIAVKTLPEGIAELRIAIGSPEGPEVSIRLEFRQTNR